MEEKQISPKKKGNIIIENRQNMSVSGITDVESFDTDKIVNFVEACIFRNYMIFSKSTSKNAIILFK